MRPVDPRGIEHGKDIAGPLVKSVEGRVVRRVAPALSPGIEPQHAVAAHQGRDVSRVGPVLEPADEADVEKERGTAAVDFIPDADPVVGGVRHRAISPACRSFGPPTPRRGGGTSYPIAGR